MSEWKGNKRPQVYRDNILTERMLNLTAQNEQKKQASFTVRYSGNKVRLTVYTGVDGDIDNGAMKLVMEPMQFMLFLQMIEEESNNKNVQLGEVTANVLTVKSLGPEGWKKGPVPRGDLYVGRDHEGAIFVSLVQPNRPKIMFKFTDNQFLSLRTKAGEPLSKTESSNLMARGYAISGKNVIAALTATEYVAKEDRPQVSNKGNNNKQSNQSNSNQDPDDFGGSSPSYHDDDIAF